MARSEEAIKRRAEKRQRTEEEQRLADRNNSGKKRKNDHQINTDHSASVSVNNDEAMKEAGAWRCSSCGNENFASRNWCNSKTCNEARPYDIEARRRDQPPRPRSTNNIMEEAGAWKCEACGNQNYASREVCYSKTCQQPRPKNATSKKKNPRHDATTSKSLVWAKPADKETLSKNQELRKQYQEAGGQGMAQEDVERAKILIARDERKRQKKEQRKQKKSSSNNDTVTKDKQEVTEAEKRIGDSPPSTEDITKSKLKSSRDRNRVLRERYMETFGKGMKPDDIERAKMLIERDVRKQKKKQENKA